MDSWELFRRLVAARRDDPLWEVLFRRCRDLIRPALRSRLAGRRQLDDAALDDLSQDVMERLLVDRRKVIRRFMGTRDVAFEAYIRRIAQNLYRDQTRHSAYRRSVETSFPSDEPWRLEAALAESSMYGTGSDPESAVVMRELSESADVVLRQISLNKRQHALNRLLYRLYFWDQCSIPQIARLSAVPLSASSVARRLALIKRVLRESSAARDHLVARPAAARGRRGQKRGISR